ncbi:hypothetical protein [Streptomyces sp. CRN 30]|uniref:hypothetical protein n=1 Tax=Streptomyces sp. CRN 30 TaxID=3075613 RepID=UPI002A83869C|nr:hypothetical protein [Streptomyces sp. CRN 30]
MDLAASGKYAPVENGRDALIFIAVYAATGVEGARVRATRGNARRRGPRRLDPGRYRRKGGGRPHLRVRRRNVRVRDMEQESPQEATMKFLIILAVVIVVLYLVMKRGRG